MSDTPNLIRASSNLPQVLVAQSVAASLSTVYQCPANKSVVVSTATLCNTAESSRTVSLSVVKAGGTAGTANRVLRVELEANESTIVEELMGLMMGPGDFVAGVSSAGSSVALVLSGAVSS